MGRVENCFLISYYFLDKKRLDKLYRCDKNMFLFSHSNKCNLCRSFGDTTSILSWLASYILHVLIIHLVISRINKKYNTEQLH